MSAKSFEPVQRRDEVSRWMHALAVDLAIRLEEDQELFQRRPRSLLVSARRRIIKGGQAITPSQAVSKSIPMPVQTDATSITEAAMRVFDGLVPEPQYRVTHLHMSASSFMAAGTSANPINRFFAKGSAEQRFAAEPPPAGEPQAEAEPAARPAKKNRKSNGIDRFLVPASSAKRPESGNSEAPVIIIDDDDDDKDDGEAEAIGRDALAVGSSSARKRSSTLSAVFASDAPTGATRCLECGCAIAPAEADEHRDFHVAQRMEREWRAAAAATSNDRGKEKLARRKGAISAFFTPRADD